ncbi:V-type ATP synthase subunit F [Methanospirillum stamsii]|uniref:Vacuolar H+transporting two-sector ATPase F subunit n=1 Tax=Methanospirillum stamsii TaxID=1277351 RepID=A0A2V2MW38_9EURY|nr:V-type ATP synthase subunit F [Methanospirillum stamsii]PWR72374.1 hypothetical protein DLD82_12355 [Methanospirillum stamsii]
MKVVLLGPQRMVMGFLLGGIHEGYVCEDTEESKKRLEECLVEPDIGIILISQSVADLIPDRVYAARTSPRMIPVVSVIPDEMRRPDTCGV